MKVGVGEEGRGQAGEESASHLEALSHPATALGIRLPPCPLSLGTRCPRQGMPQTPGPGPCFWKVPAREDIMTDVTAFINLGSGRVLRALAIGLCVIVLLLIFYYEKI